MWGKNDKAGGGWTLTASADAKRKENAARNEWTSPRKGGSGSRRPPKSGPEK